MKAEPTELDAAGLKNHPRLLSQPAHLLDAALVAMLTAWTEFTSGPTVAQQGIGHG